MTATANTSIPTAVHSKISRIRFQPLMAHGSFHLIRSARLAAALSNSRFGPESNLSIS